MHEVCYEALDNKVHFAGFFYSWAGLALAGSHQSWLLLWKCPNSLNQKLEKEISPKLRALKTMQLYEYTDLLFCTKSTLFHLLLIFWAELQRQASIEIGVGSWDKATSILSLPLSSPPPPACLLTQNWCKTALSLICISSLASNILSMPFSSVSSCLLTQKQVHSWMGQFKR